jgi:hypothetical protein
MDVEANAGHVVKMLADNKPNDLAHLTFRIGAWQGDMRDRVGGHGAELRART